MKPSPLFSVSHPPSPSLNRNLFLRSSNSVYRKQSSPPVTMMIGMLEAV